MRKAYSVPSSQFSSFMIPSPQLELSDVQRGKAESLGNIGAEAGEHVVGQEGVALNLCQGVVSNGCLLLQRRSGRRIVIMECRSITVCCFRALSADGAGYLRRLDLYGGSNAPRATVSIVPGLERPNCFLLSWKALKASERLE